MLSVLREKFEERKSIALALIESYSVKYNLHWEDIGVFGSYARDTASGSSDLDICIIAEKPDPFISGNLREEADAIKVDIVFLTKENFLNGTSLLSRNIRQDIIFVKGGFSYEK